jgi:3-deoxy-D-manno-octulosonate 8-phosphate phosphatase KdsC-like HAD superfamily phosphatase
LTETPNNNDNNNDNNNKTEQIKKSGDLLNNLLNKSFIIISFSVKPAFAPIIKEFNEIVKREAGFRGRSEVIMKLITDYVKAHRVGNPQLLLTHYIESEKEPQPIRVLCVYCDGALSEGKVYCQKRGMWIPSVSCYSCRENRLRKRESA